MPGKSALGAGAQIGTVYISICKSDFRPSTDSAFCGGSSQSDAKATDRGADGACRRGRRPRPARRCAGRPRTLPLSRPHTRVHALQISNPRRYNHLAHPDSHSIRPPSKPSPSSSPSGIEHPGGSEGGEHGRRWVEVGVFHGQRVQVGHELEGREGAHGLAEGGRAGGALGGVRRGRRRVGGRRTG